MIDPVDLTLVRLDPEALLSALARGGVDFVVIGGIAAVLHGDPMGTEDVDTTIRRTSENIEALVRVLREIDARLLVALNERDVATVDVPITIETFAPFTSGRFLTRHGVLDIVLRPDGIPEYQQWVQNATTVALATGVEVQLASLDDVIASKAAANRPKDQYALARLRALRDFLIARQGGNDSSPD